MNWIFLLFPIWNLYLFLLSVEITVECYFRKSCKYKGSFSVRNVLKIKRIMTTSDVLFACQKCYSVIPLEDRRLLRTEGYRLFTNVADCDHTLEFSWFVRVLLITKLSLWCSKKLAVSTWTEREQQTDRQELKTRVGVVLPLGNSVQK